MKQRIITGAVLIALLIPVLIYSHTWVFSAAFTLLAVTATWEMLKCVGMGKKWSAAIPAYIYTLAVTLGAKWVPDSTMYAWAYIGVTFFFFIWIGAAAIFSKGKFTVDSMFAVFGSIFYVASAFAALIFLRDCTYGNYLYLVALFLPWISDTFAYFTGVFFGKHKLIPDVSPKKTIEGSIGGIVFSGIGCVIFLLVVMRSKSFDVTPVHYAAVFVAGALVAILSQIGDLLASLIKRRFDVKDYGVIFPGHGGVMDRLDSVLITSPLILLFNYALQYFVK